MVDRPPSEPETVWGACQALLQAGAGVAYLLEDHRTIGVLLLALAVATAIYETVAWVRAVAEDRPPGPATTAG
jgi:hypothetical protein